MNTCQVEYNSLYGPSIPEMGWVPSPSYLMRRSRILRVIEQVSPCRLLEVGCGAGALLHELALKGFTCSALETSPHAFEIASKMNTEMGVIVRDKPDTRWRKAFDCLMACEVLEHCEDDRATLIQWREWLKPGGLILLSVPAHMNQWNASDEWAGHYRRYEENSFKSLIRDCGFQIDFFELYGSPLGNFIDPIRSRIHKRQLELRNTTGGDRVINTSMSGIERSAESKIYPYLCSLPGRVVMHLAFGTQALLARIGVGKGYIIMARKSVD